MSTEASSAGAAAQGRIDHVASEHTLDTTFAAVPTLGSASQLRSNARPNRAATAGHVQAESSGFSPRQSGVRRKLSLPDSVDVLPSAPLQACVAALDTTADAVLIVDRAGVVQYVNRACEVLLGRERADQRTVGRHVLGLVCLNAGALRQVLRALRKDSVWNGSLQVELGTRVRALELSICKVGRSTRAQNFSIVARPARAVSATATTTAAATNTSVSTSALAPQHNVDVLSTIARVASEMAHDFNNQIAVVLNYSFILLRELPGKSPMRTHVVELQGAAWRAAEITREVLRFGARRKVEPSEIDVHQLLCAAQAILCSMLGSDETLVELRLSNESCRLLARRAQLEWLLLELSAQLRARIGRLARLRISTSITSATNGSRPEQDGRLLIALDAHPAQHSQLGVRDHVLAEEQARHARTSQPRLQPQGLHAAERALEQARGELTSHMLPDGGVRYLLSFPALR